MALCTPHDDRRDYRKAFARSRFDGSRFSHWPRFKRTTNLLCRVHAVAMMMNALKVCGAVHSFWGG